MRGLATRHRMVVPAVSGPALLVALLAFAAPAAFAQAQTEPPAPQTQPPATQRPVRGLFGGIERDPTRYRSLDLSVSLFGGYDDNIDPEGRGGSGDPRFGESGGTGNGTAALTYRRGRNDAFFTASGRAGYRYYPSLSELNAADFGGNLGFTVRPTGRTELSARQDVAYQPHFSLSAVPIFAPDAGGGPGLGTMDYSFTERPSLTYNTNADATYDFSRRTHAAAGYSFRGLDFTGEADDGRLRDHVASAGLTRDFTRRWRVGARYVFGRGENYYGGEGSTTSSQGADLTFDYRRTLRTRRQLTLGFAPGFSRHEIENDRFGRRVDRRITASLHASVDVARSWRLRGDYRRGLRQIPGIREAVFADDVQVLATGLVSRRTDMSMRLQYTEGDPGFARNGFTTLSGMAQGRVALTRSLAMTVQYMYYHYEFGPDAVLPAEMSRRFDRHALRAGFDLWLPLHR